MKYLFFFIFLLSPFIVYGQEPPQVAIVQPLNGALFDGGQIKVDYLVSGTPPKSARILVDDRPVQLLTETEVKIGLNTVIVNVPMRDCKISVIAQNEFGASVTAVVNLKRNELIFKPTLYVLSIGVSKYKNRELQLQFAAKDAMDFSLAMAKQQGLLYEKVQYKILLDEEANAENIRDGLQWLKRETTQRDVAMLYMAGHGINSNDGYFFFMPVNADMDRLNATCVRWMEIKETVDATPGKMLVFVDACHSGNVLGNNQRRAAMLSQAISELTGADNGAIVFTSSTGRQFSLENPDWNNGVFTKALVEGLNGAADLSDTKTITVNSLMWYITNRVKELTKGQQAPTTTIPSSIPDFPIAFVAATETSNTNNETVKPSAVVIPVTKPEISASPTISVPITSNAKIEMIFVQGGTFTMGSPDEVGNTDERPQHQVTLGSFHIGKYQITQAQWIAVMGSNPSHFKGDNLPVETVSWNDIVGTTGVSVVLNGITYYENGFIYKLNKLTGKTFRLPTEAEWEYAARGGNKSQSHTYSGSNTIGNVACYSSNSGDATQPVGSKAPNELGVYDMSGNVWEWCSNRYNSSYHSDLPQNNPTGPSSGSYRVLRGGSWYSLAENCRVAYRYDYAPDYRNYNNGFRVALVP